MPKEIQELGLKIDNRFDKLDSFLVESERREIKLLEKIEGKIDWAEKKIADLEKDFAKLTSRQDVHKWGIVALFVLFVIVLMTIWWQA